LSWAEAGLASMLASATADAVTTDAKTLFNFIIPPLALFAWFFRYVVSLGPVLCIQYTKTQFLVS
jgi:hypothetical protein